MTTQYTPILKLALPVTGELSGLWGDVVNENITSMVEQAIAGLATINSWATNSHTLTTADGTTSESRCAMLVADDDGAGNPSAAATIVCPNATKLYVLKNISGQTVTLKTAAGSGVAVPNNQTAFLFCDGTNVNSAVTTLVTGGTVNGDLSVTGNVTLGDSSSDTVAINGKVTTDIIPSTDNTKDLGTVANSWRTLYLDTSALIANISIVGNTISSTDTNGNITLQPNGTGDVVLSADTIQVGDAGATATITTNGAGNLVLNTNGGANSGSITIANGANANITIQPNGTGDIYASADTLYVGDFGASTTIASNGGGNLSLYAGTNSIRFESATVFADTAASVTGSLKFNTDAFVIDATNKRIGVGIANPSYAAHIIGSISASAYASNRIPYIDSSTSGLFVDSANLTFSSSSNKLSVNGIDIWRGNNGSLTTNTAIGTNALQSNTTGTNKTAVGYGAVTSITGSNITGIGYVSAASAGANSTAVGSYSLAYGSAESNSAFGFMAGYNVGGTYNVAIGAEALSGSTQSSGGNNVAIGKSTLNSLTTGLNNIAIGESALNLTTSASTCIAIGKYAGKNRTSGFGNIAIGTQALESQSTSGTGNDNIAIGAYSLLVASTAAQNVAIGTNALVYATTGTTNVAVGYNAGHDIETGTNNVCIGYNAGSDSLHAIGGSSSNIIILGNNSSTQAFIKVSWTVVSDARDKTAFAPVPHGLNFVTQLKPTAYNLRKERGSDEVTDGSRVRYGFLAQDILALEGDNPVIIDETDPENLKFNESSLIPVLVNAIKELKAEVDALKTKLAGA